MERQAYCPECGKKILKREEGLYCVFCGKAVSAEERNSGFCFNCRNLFKNSGLTPRYCSRCGRELKEENGFGQAGKAEVKSGQNAVKTKNAFIEPNERAISALGIGYAQNIISGSGVKRGNAILTNKRIYYKGKALVRETV